MNWYSNERETEGARKQPPSNKRMKLSSAFERK